LENFTTSVRYLYYDIFIMKTKFRPCEHKHVLLLLPSIMDLFPEKHLIHFIIDVVGQLGISAVYLSYDNEPGQTP
jgi:hypothetical protein